jgi:PAS domain S-box-containing protein
MAPETDDPMKRNSITQQDQRDRDDAARVAWIYALCAAAWILLSDWLLDRYFGGAALGAQLGTLKGWLFVVFTAAVLYATLRYRRDRYAKSETRSADSINTSFAAKWPVLQLTIAIVTILALTAITIYFRYSEIEQREAARIEAIADSRAEEVTAWLRHRLAETEFVRSSPLMAELYGKWRDFGDKTSLQRLRDRVSEYRKANEYESAIVSDEHGKTIVRDNDAVSRGASAELIAAVLRALATGQTQRTPLYYREGAPAASRIDFAIPLMGKGSTARGTISLRVDAAEFLFPLLKRWPVATTSGETLLVSRSGDKITFLSPLRYRNDAPGTFAVKNEKLLAVRASATAESDGLAMHAVDYRGVGVLGTARTVAGSDWLIIAKIDHAEIVAASLHDAAWIALAGLIAIIAACAIGASHRARSALQMAAIRHEEQARQLQTLQLLNAIADASTDAIFAKDRDGNYLLFNRESCRITGKAEKEVLGRDDRALFSPEQAEKMKQENLRVIAENKTATFEESLKTVDGERIFLSTKGPLHDADGNISGTFGIAHDITERKRNELAVAKAASMLQAIQDSIENQMVVLDRNGAILAVNEAWRSFALENSHSASVVPANTGLTTNYLDICCKANGDFSDDAAAACTGLRQILDGKRDDFALEYPCHAPTEKRWFLMNAVPLKSADGGAVVVHTNITARKRNELLQAEQSRILEMITADTAITDVLDAIARSVEALGDRCALFDPADR